MATEAKKKLDPKRVRVLTPEARASHPHVFKPSAIKDGDPESYSIELLFDKKTTDLSVITNPIKYVIEETWGKDKSKWPKPLSLPYRDGDKPHGTKREVKDEHKGMWVVRASSKAEYSKPHVVGRNPNVTLTEESQFYAGCYCRAALKAHPWKYAGKEGVKFILDGVQFSRDGEPFGGKLAADQIFGVIEGDDTDELNDDSFDDASGDDSFL